MISLGFSNLGGPEVVQEYFADKGKRSYEDRIYENLGEFYRDPRYRPSPWLRRRALADLPLDTADP